MNWIYRSQHRLAFTIILLFSAFCSVAQHQPATRRRIDSLISLHHPTPTDSMIQSRLVILALQGPRYEAATHQVGMATQQMNIAKRSWLNLLSISGNVNQFDLQPQASTAQYLYPKYLIGITIPIGLFFELGPEVKAARENVAVTRNNQEDLARTIRMQVLSQYTTYKNYSNLILLQNTVLVDEQAALNQIEKKFQDGSISIDQYNTANRAYTDERVKMLNLQLAQDLVRLDIERLIGVSLDTVIK